MAFNQATHDRLLKREAKYAEQDDAATKKLRTLIHVGKGDLLMADDTYLILLSEVAGRPVASSTELEPRELQAVLDRMKQAGFKIRHSKAGGGKSRALSMDAQAQKLRAMWIEMHELGMVRDPSEAALCSWAANSRSPNVTTILDLIAGTQEMDKTIERLKQWRARLLRQGKFTCPQCDNSFVPTQRQALAWPYISCDAHEPPVAYQWRREADGGTG